jgi:ATP phosphoribosyltransferase regulatory subunit
MPQEYRWYLPDGINEVLPPESGNLERIRREILDLFHCWGYELVVPPLMEYLESLLTGTGHELDLQTFKVTDQLTGRLLGVRADMTPQVARIDAHGLKRDAPTRLCYLGPVLHTVPNTFAGSRNPFQVGAEIYGHDGVASDTEVLCLTLESLRVAGAESEICVDLGHMAILRCLAQRAGLSTAQSSQLFDLLQRKAKSDVDAYCSELSMPAAYHEAMLGLIGLNGDASVLQEAQRVLAVCAEELTPVLTELQELTELVAARNSNIRFHFDLAEVGGYRYYTGVSFAAYLPGYGQALAKGGRYNDIGRVFGRARPATGFSTDIKRLIGLGPRTVEAPQGIFAPWSNDTALTELVARLRRSGKRVVSALPGQTATAAEMQCNQTIDRRHDAWTVVDL